MQGHRIRWFGILPDGSRVPRNRHMAGADWGWDAHCSCGQDSRTGGAIQERVREWVRDHLADAEWNASHVWDDKTLQWKLRDDTEPRQETDR